MAVGFINGLRRLVEIMEVTELVWHIGEHLRNSTADGQLAIRNNANNGHLQGLTDCPEQGCQIRLGCGQQTTSQENFPREAVPEDPEHLMTDIRLETIQRQNNPALGLVIRCRRAVSVSARVSSSS
jgi:hypothetical protein